MKININGITRDMTPEEEAEISLLGQNETEPTEAERIAALESAVLEMILGGVSGV